MKTNRIFVDAHVLDHGFEGTASYIIGLYTALLREFSGRYKLYLGCNRPDLVSARFGKLQEVEVVKYDSKSTASRLVADMPRLIRQINPHYAHFQYVAPFIKTCKWIVTIHDVLFNDFPQYFPRNYRHLRNVLFPLSGRRADVLTTVSEYSKDRIGFWYGIPRNKIHVIPNGIAAESNFPSRLQANDARVRAVLQHVPGYILCVSRFDARKNQELLLRAFLKGELWNRGLHLVFVGSNPKSSDAFNALLTSAEPVARRAVSLLSGIDDNDLRELYKSALVSVYPSFAEGFGMPPIEAIAMGTPSMCVPQTAMRDFDFPEKFSFSPNSVSELLSKLSWILENRGAAMSITRKLSIRVNEQYTWARSCRLLHGQISTHEQC